MGAMKMTMVVVMTVFTAAMAGEVYKVGDSDGWTSTIGHPDYKKWASTQKFRVGDKIVFQYAKPFHNVARVSYKDFQTCNASKPYSILTSGNDTFSIMFPGHYFFICTHLDHCRSGQKVDIRVPFPPPRSTPPPVSAVSPSPIQPLPFPYPPPQVPSPSPSPSPSPVTLSPAPTQSPVPMMHKESPAPSVVVSAPEIAPSMPKSSGSQLGFGVRIWTMIVMVIFYLV